MPGISVLIKPASSMCNMHCEYCFYLDEAQNRQMQSYGFMTEVTLKNVIRRTILRAEGAISYAFQGGEPTLRGLDFFRQVIQYQKQYNRNHVRVMNALQTNGYIIDEEWCRFLKEHHFLVGVSVDGMKELHDQYRHTKSGESTFDTVLHTTRLFDEYEVDYNILTVVTKDIARRIREVYESYKAHGWMYQQYIACLEPLGQGHGNAAFAVNAVEYGRFLIQLFELWYADLRKGKQPYIRQFENYIGILCGYRPEACDMRGVCSEQYVVEADGSVYPCDFYTLDTYRLGNFNEDRLDILDKKRKEINFIGQAQKLSAACSNCAWFTLCRGGCRRNRDCMEDGGYKNYLCEGYKMFFESCFDKMQKIAPEAYK